MEYARHVGSKSGRKVFGISCPRIVADIPILDPDLPFGSGSAASDSSASHSIFPARTLHQLLNGRKVVGIGPCTGGCFDPFDTDDASSSLSSNDPLLKHRYYTKHVGKTLGSKVVALSCCTDCVARIQVITNGLAGFDIDGVQVMACIEQVACERRRVVKANVCQNIGLVEDFSIRADSDFTNSQPDEFHICTTGFVPIAPIVAVVTNLTGILGGPAGGGSGLDICVEDMKGTRIIGPGEFTQVLLDDLIDFYEDPITTLKCGFITMRCEVCGSSSSRSRSSRSFSSSSRSRSSGLSDCPSGEPIVWIEAFAVAPGIPPDPTAGACINGQCDVFHFIRAFLVTGVTPFTLCYFSNTGREVRVTVNLVNPHCAPVCVKYTDFNGVAVSDTVPPGTSYLFRLTPIGPCPSTTVNFTVEPGEC